MRAAQAGRWPAEPSSLALLAAQPAAAAPVSPLPRSLAGGQCAGGRRPANHPSSEVGRKQLLLPAAVAGALRRRRAGLPTSSLEAELHAQKRCPCPSLVLATRSTTTFLASVAARKAFLAGLPKGEAAALEQTQAAVSGLVAFNTSGCSFCCLSLRAACVPVRCNAWNCACPALLTAPPTTCSLLPLLHAVTPALTTADMTDGMALQTLARGPNVSRPSCCRSARPGAAATRPRRHNAPHAWICCGVSRQNQRSATPQRLLPRLIPSPPRRASACTCQCSAARGGR